MSIKRSDRIKQNKHNPCIVWFTGLSGSGKSTIAIALENKLFKLGYRTYLLDGDDVRQGLNKDLGFTDLDRAENIRRVTEVAQLMLDAGLIVIATFISPHSKERKFARDRSVKEKFFEVYVNTPLEICEKRDTKGLYKKARSGDLKDFTGVSSKYQPPKKPDIILNGYKETPDQNAEKIFELIKQIIKLK